MNFRALSDKWQFRRKQKKWLRRKDSPGTAPQDDGLFSSTEDILDTSNAPDDSSPPRSESPPMMVSELRKSLTGLDRTVKTYSFMVGEDQMPVIQVEPPQPTATAATMGSLVQMSSAYSSFDSDEDEKWESDPYPHGGMDNFATGMMDTFESNLLKLKDFQTQSLPDIFEATKHFADDVSDISPLSSASASTVSILDSANALDPPLDYPGSRVVNPSSMSPLALNGHISPPTRDGTQFKIGETDDTYSSTSEKKPTPQDEISNRYERVESAASSRTWESNSPMGSESSERDLSAPSPQLMVLERLKFSLSNGVISGNVVANGLDSPSHQRQYSSEDGTNKRSSKISISSYKHGEDTGSLKYVLCVYVRAGILSTEFSKGVVTWEVLCSSVHQLTEYFKTNPDLIYHVSPSGIIGDGNVLACDPELNSCWDGMGVTG